MTTDGLFQRCLRVASAIALVVAVLTSPIRSVPGAGGRPTPNYLRRTFACPVTSPPAPAGHHHPTKTVPSAQLRLKALTAESEPKQLLQAECTGRLFTRVSVCVGEPAFEPAPLGEPRASHPLRC